MITYISILRGINVSGQKLIKMEALKKMYETLNFENVQTYVQSGNVIFSSKETNLKNLETQIVAQINRDFGHEVPVIVLTAATLKNIVSNNPFADNKDNSFLHVTFLAEEPKPFDPKILNDKKLPNEEFELRKDVVYLYCPNGYGQTKLTNNFLENKLKVTATTRNWKTTNELLKIASQ